MNLSATSLSNCRSKPFPYRYIRACLVCLISSTDKMFPLPWYWSLPRYSSLQIWRNMSSLERRDGKSKRKREREEAREDLLCPLCRICSNLIAVNRVNFQSHGISSIRSSMEIGDVCLIRRTPMQSAKMERFRDWITMYVEIHIGGRRFLSENNCSDVPGNPRMCPWGESVAYAFPSFSLGTWT